MLEPVGRRKGFMVLLLFTLGVLAGCSSPDETGVYKMSTAEVYKRLVDSRFEEFLGQQQCGILIHLKRSGVHEKSVTWQITSRGREMVYMIARLTPRGADRTKIDIEIGPKEWNGREAYDGSHMYMRPAVRQPVRPALEAQIDAALGVKPYDVVEVARKGGNRDTVCNVQRGGLQAGVRVFSIDDPEVKGRIHAVAR